MTEAVLDASVVLKWFRAEDERHAEAANDLRERFLAGEFAILAPDLIYLEVLNVAARRWRWEWERLARLVVALETLAFVRVATIPAHVAEWCARGLSSYDAAYVSAAEMAGVPLITDDQPICRIAPLIAQPLADFAR